MLSQSPPEGEALEIFNPNPKIEIKHLESNSLLKVYISYEGNNIECRDPFTEITVEDNESGFSSIGELELEFKNGEGEYNLYAQISDPYGNVSECLYYDSIRYNYVIKTPNVYLVDENGNDLERFLIDEVSESDSNTDIESSEEQTTIYKPVVDYSSEVYMKADGLISGNRLQLFFLDSANASNCSNSFFDEEITSSSTDVINGDLKQGERDYFLYYQIVDRYGQHSECIHEQKNIYTFKFLKPKLSKIFPTSETINQNDPTIEFSDLFLRGKNSFYLSYNGNNSNCLNPFLEGDIEEESKRISLDLNQGDGEYVIFSQLEDDFGNKSSCFEHESKYVLDTIVPEKPIPGSHIDINGDSTGAYQFIFSYTGGSSTEILSLYTDDECEVGIGSFEYEDSGYTAGVTDAQNQSISIYGKFIDLGGNESECSDLLGEYELELKVTGVLTYDFVPVSSAGLLFDLTEERPIRNVYIELFDMDPLSDFYNQPILNTVTNDQGGFEFFLSTNRTVKVVLHARMSEPETIIYDNPQNYARYAASSSTHEVTGHEIINIHAGSGWVGSQSSGSYSGARSAALLPFWIQFILLIRK